MNNYYLHKYCKETNNNNQRFIYAFSIQDKFPLVVLKSLHEEKHFTAIISHLKHFCMSVLDINFGYI